MTTTEEVLSKWERKARGIISNGSITITNSERHAAEVIEIIIREIREARETEKQIQLRHW